MENEMASNEEKSILTDSDAELDTVADIEEEEDEETAPIKSA